MTQSLVLHGLPQNDPLFVFSILTLTKFAKIIRLLIRPAKMKQVYGCFSAEMPGHQLVILFHPLPEFTMANQPINKPYLISVITLFPHKYLVVYEDL